MSPTLIVFARAPVAGRCKTRLIPVLGEDGAAHLYARLLQRTLVSAEALPSWRLRLQALDADARRFFLSRLDQRRWDVRLQEGTDLGVRMVRALNEAVVGGKPALLIGSDILDWALDDLTEAASALVGASDVAIAPAHDGGFWLLGTRAPLPESLFLGLVWGTSAVYAQAKARLVEQGMQVNTLSIRHDIDVPADLERHAEALAKLSPADHRVAGWGGAGDRPGSSGAASSLTGSSGSN